MRCRAARFFGAVVLLLSLLPAAFAQAVPQAASDKGSITGTVTDQTQAVVAGAKVTLTNTAGE